MFILLWLILQIVKANHTVVPHTVNLLVNIAAGVELGLYVLLFVMHLVLIYIIARDK